MKTDNIKLVRDMFWTKTYLGYGQIMKITNNGSGLSISCVPVDPVYGVNISYIATGKPILRIPKVSDKRKEIVKENARLAKIFCAEFTARKEEFLCGWISG